MAYRSPPYELPENWKVLRLSKGADRKRINSESSAGTRKLNYICLRNKKSIIHSTKVENEKAKLPTRSVEVQTEMLNQRP